MQRERVAALVIMLLMIFSVAGFAVSGLRITGSAVNEPQQQQPSIPTISNRLLTGEEIAHIVRSGRVLIESVYNKNCGDCRVRDQELRTFALKYSGFVFMESVEVDYGEGWEKLQMIGSSGEILDLRGKEFTEAQLFEDFCSHAAVKPRQCFLQTLEQFLNQGNKPQNATGNETGNASL